MFALNGALFGIWASRIPAVAERHALGPGALGLLLLMMAAGAICAFPLAGRGADRLGAYRLTWGLAVVYTATLALLALAPGPRTLGAALFLFGAAHGAMDVAMNAWAGEVERRLRRPCMSFFHAMFSLGAGLGAGSGFLAARAGLGIAPHFLLAGALLAAAALALARIEWRAEPRRAAPGRVFALPKGPLAAVGFVAFCAALGEGAMADWSAIFIVLTTGATEAAAALGYAAFSVAMVAMRLAGDRVIARAGAVRAARGAGLLAATGVALAVLLPGYGAALAGFALMGLGYAVVMPLAFSRAANDPQVPPGTAIASVATLGYGGILLGPPVIGFAAEATSLPVAFGLLLVLALAIAALAPAMRPRALAQPA
ncbi:MFS transporter [Rhodobacteraceae bacterium 2CG4]|uniref:MFS transporter n=2 Tax=Halovulum marinum TaxID=2662447 RepID=A0A6L5Z265_9RHOB|nr:MFS transporter [Halovulum marinum]